MLGEYKDEKYGQEPIIFSQKPMEREKNAGN